MVRHKFPPTLIFNMDETGISDVQDPGLIALQNDKEELALSFTS
jgi:hypothetical protein